MSYDFQIIRLQNNNFTHNMWGGDWIPRLKGINWPPDKPVGESWEISGHPHHPSRLFSLKNPGQPLSQLIEEQGEAILGPSVVKQFGNKIPFLVKLIDARDDLSVQVHPDRAYACAHENDSGKAENWIILDVGPEKGEGCIYLGFSEGKERKDSHSIKTQFLKAIQAANGKGPSDDPRVRQESSDLVLPFLNKANVNSGDGFEINPGTIHAIGKGIRLFEIQQSSDLTYRVWDWNRPDAEKKKQGIMAFRPLHLNKAKDVLDFTPRSVDDFKCVKKEIPWDGKGKGRIWESLKNPIGQFSVHHIVLGEEGCEIEMPTSKAFFVLTCIKGTAALLDGGENITQGETLLVPASTPKIQVKALTERVDLFKSFCLI